MTNNRLEEMFVKYINYKCLVSREYNGLSKIEWLEKYTTKILKDNLPYKI